MSGRATGKSASAASTPASASSGVPPTGTAASDSEAYRPAARGNRTGAFTPRARDPNGSGGRLFAARSALGLSLDALAKGAGCSVQICYDYEMRNASGYRENGAVRETAHRIAMFLGTTVEHVWGASRIAQPVRRGRRGPYALPSPVSPSSPEVPVLNRRLVAERVARGLTQGEAAELAGLHLVTLARMERFSFPAATRGGRHTRAARAIARAYGRDAHWLFAEAFVPVRVRPSYPDLEVDEAFFGLQESPEETYARHETVARALAATAAGPVRERFVLLLAGWTTNEIAEHQGVSRQAVECAMRVARIRMRYAAEE